MDEAEDRQTPLDPFDDGILRLKVGWSAHDAILRNEATRSVQAFSALSDLDLAVGEEGVRRDGKIERRRPLADTARGSYCEPWHGQKKPS